MKTDDVAKAVSSAKADSAAKVTTAERMGKEVDADPEVREAKAVALADREAARRAKVHFDACLERRRLLGEQLEAAKSECTELEHASASALADVSRSDWMEIGEKFKTAHKSAEERASMLTTAKAEIDTRTKAADIANSTAWSIQMESDRRLRKAVDSATQRAFVGLVSDAVTLLWGAARAADSATRGNDHSRAKRVSRLAEVLFPTEGLTDEGEAAVSTWLRSIYGTDGGTPA
ncbi:hypothetical protein DFR24_2243 [Panacagrimonas perspica]|uniref:Uncharacterized protein n=1 Tax=Panacagrimonas perspica TaxID=381431 RepID=A0A4V3UQZ7_9GAMM|nr:hypothetical protein [Panacagrimonas perspica]TDU32835.1 hypothetical protein DFR24_2243 [Panacagrimonas perspica]THD00951.1 hypothetical protein B1810_22080 [Panacagrimonas perspica]